MQLLIARYGTLSAVLAADRHALASLVGHAAAGLLHAASEALSLTARRRLLARPVIGNLKQLVDYLRLSDACAQAERLRVLHLNARLALIYESVVPGTVDSTKCETREVIQTSLNLGTTAMIIAHNHPSGDPTPSDADLAFTRKLAATAKMVDISLHDHIIVAQSGWTSLRREGLL